MWVQQIFSTQTSGRKTSPGSPTDLTPGENIPPEYSLMTTGMRRPVPSLTGPISTRPLCHRPDLVTSERWASLNSTKVIISPALDLFWLCKCRVIPTFLYLDFLMCEMETKTTSYGHCGAKWKWRTVASMQELFQSLLLLGLWFLFYDLPSQLQ